MVLLLSCSNSEQSNVPIEEDKKFEYFTSKDKKDLLTFRNNLRESDYYYTAEITSVDFTIIKDAYKVKADQYSEGKFEDGIQLSFNFNYTNPYSKTMIVPIPTNFFITVDGNTDYGSYSKGRHCNIIAYGKVTSPKGKELSDMYDETLESSDRYGFKFKAGETKSFLVTFDNPLPLDLNKVLMIGFAESKAGWVDGVESGLEIDIPNKSIERKVFLHK